MHHASVEPLPLRKRLTTLTVLHQPPDGSRSSSGAQPLATTPVFPQDLYTACAPSTTTRLGPYTYIGRPADAGEELASDCPRLLRHERNVLKLPLHQLSHIHGLILLLDLLLHLLGITLSRWEDLPSPLCELPKWRDHLLSRKVIEEGRADPNHGSLGPLFSRALHCCECSVRDHNLMKACENEATGEVFELFASLDEQVARRHGYRNALSLAIASPVSRSF